MTENVTEIVKEKKKMKHVVTIETADRDEVERLHYQVESLASLIERLASKVTVVTNSDEVFNRYLKEYTMCFKKYNECKEYLEQKYKPADIANTARSWELNFESAEMTFEVDDAS